MVYSDIMICESKLLGKRIRRVGNGWLLEKRALKLQYVVAEKSLGRGQTIRKSERIIKSLNYVHKQTKLIYLPIYIYCMYCQGNRLSIYKIKTRTARYAAAAVSSTYLRVLYKYTLFIVCCDTVLREISLSFARKNDYSRLNGYRSSLHPRPIHPIKPFV